MTGAPERGNENGRVAIVTGSGRGLGQAMALGLLAAGFRVTVNDADDGAIDNTVRAAVAAGASHRVLGLRADISNPDSEITHIKGQLATRS